MRFRILINCNKFFYNSRNISTSVHHKKAYDSDGKTTVTILNKEVGYGVMVDGYSKVGFRLNNGLFVFGPMILFPHTALSWNVGSDLDINRKSLRVFGLIEPKLDLVVVGYGMRSSSMKTFNEEVFALKKETRINFEILPVESATATFNYLSSEGRWVAGAFIPPVNIRSNDDIVINTRERKQLYSED